MSLGGYTLGTGVTNACLYRVEYLAWEMLEHMMIRITEHGAGFRRTRYAQARDPRLSFLSDQRAVVQVHIVELVNDILFDIPSHVCLPRTGYTEAMISHLIYKMRKLSKIIG